MNRPFLCLCIPFYMMFFSLQVNSSVFHRILLNRFYCRRWEHFLWVQLPSTRPLWEAPVEKASPTIRRPVMLLIFVYTISSWPLREHALLSMFIHFEYSQTPSTVNYQKSRATTSSRMPFNKRNLLHLSTRSFLGIHNTIIHCWSTCVFSLHHPR